MALFIGILTMILISGFMAVMASLFFHEIPPGNRETFVYMAGQLSGFAGASIVYFYGTTHGSARKTEILAKAEPVKE